MRRRIIAGNPPIMMVPALLVLVYFLASIFWETRGGRLCWVYVEPARCPAACRAGRNVLGEPDCCCPEGVKP